MCVNHGRRQRARPRPAGSRRRRPAQRERDHGRSPPGPRCWPSISPDRAGSDSPRWGQHRGPLFDGEGLAQGKSATPTTHDQLQRRGFTRRFKPRRVRCQDVGVGPLGTGLAGERAGGTWSWGGCRRPCLDGPAVVFLEDGHAFGPRQDVARRGPCCWPSSSSCRSTSAKLPGGGPPLPRHRLGSETRRRETAAGAEGDECNRPADRLARREPPPLWPAPALVYSSPWSS